MGPQDTSVQQPQYPGFPGQSSDVDFEAAEQLLQHSRRGRESNGESMPGSALEPETIMDLPESGGDREIEDEFVENGNEHEHGGSGVQERRDESQYAPINNQPPLGQICRYNFN